ncbi:MAG: hypothetical protein O3A46_13760 [Candidatus Poribacteria bacterium]|nr:hypothetical protein [Candidatus Poribacteria bacterium]
MNQDRLGQHNEQDEDPFLETVNRGIEFAKERAIPLAFAGALIIAAILGGVWFASSRTGSRVDDYVQMYDALVAFEDAQAATDAERAKELDGVISKLNAIQNPTYVPRARFIQGSAALAKGDGVEAARLFQSVVGVKNGVYGMYAQLGIGAAKEAQSDWNGALQAYAESAIAPYAAVPGYDSAWAEAAMGRARAARQSGDPNAARQAYEALVAKHVANRDKAIDARRQDLVEEAKSFLEVQEVPNPPSDLNALNQRLGEWIQATLQKPETQQTGLIDATRIQGDVEDFLKGMADAKKAIAQNPDDQSPYSYQIAAGDKTVTPTREQYQRAVLELERLGQMTPSQ